MVYSEYLVSILLCTVCVYIFDEINKTVQKCQGQVTPSPKINDNPNIIYIPFIPREISRAKFRELFERFGPIKKISSKSNSDKSGWVGYVTYKNEEDFFKALRVQSIELNSGYEIKFEKYESREPIHSNSQDQEKNDDNSSSSDDSFVSSTAVNGDKHHSNSRGRRFERNSARGSDSLNWRSVSRTRDLSQPKNPTTPRNPSTVRPPNVNDKPVEKTKVYVAVSKPPNTVPSTKLYFSIQEGRDMGFLTNGQPYAAASLCRQLKSIMNSISTTRSMDQNRNSKDGYSQTRDKSLPRPSDSSGVCRHANWLPSNLEENASLKMQFIVETRALFERFEETKIESPALQMYMLSNLIWLDAFLIQECRGFSSITNNELKSHVKQLQESVEEIKCSLCTQFLNDVKKTLEDLIIEVVDDTKSKDSKSWQLFCVARVIHVLEDTFEIVIHKSKVVKKLGYAIIGRILRFINYKTYNEVMKNPRKWLKPSPNYFLLELPNMLSLFLEQVKDWEKKNSPKEKVGREPSYDSDASTNGKTKSGHDLEDFMSDVKDEIMHLTQLRKLLRSKDKYFEETVNECPDLSNDIIECVSSNYKWEIKREEKEFQAKIIKKLSGREVKNAKFEWLDEGFVNGRKLFKDIKNNLRELNVELAGENDRSLFLLLPTK